jgi:hypothetical protein
MDMNPQLEDVSPAEMLAEGRSPGVMPPPARSSREVDRVDARLAPARARFCGQSCFIKCFHGKQTQVRGP